MTSQNNFTEIMNNVADIKLSALQADILPSEQLGKPKEMGISDHLTFLLRNLYAGQEATVRTGHGTTDWLQIMKGLQNH